MDALNFLYQRPTVTWFDFYLEPFRLQEYANNTKPDPSIDVLIFQFCEQAKYEETLFAQTDLPADILEHHKAKSKKLWLLALKVCSYCSWNIVKLRKCVSLVNLKRIVEELCAVTWDTNTLSFVLTSTQSFDELSPSLKFTAIFTARWVIDSCVCNSFPEPPPKITVSNPSTQSDPSYAIIEAKALCLATLKVVCDLAVQFLEKVLESSVTEYRILLPECFEIPIEGSGDIYLNLDAVDVQPVELVKFQIKYDLAVYYFFAGEYNKAKKYFTELSTKLDIIKTVESNKYWTFEENSIKGYCDALNISLNVHNNTPTAICLKATPSEQTAVILLDSTKNVSPSTVLRSIIEETALSQKNPIISAQIASANILRHLQGLYGVVDSWINFFNIPENVAMFCVALNKRMNALMSENEQNIIKIYLNFICACLPSLREKFVGCGLNNLLWSISPIQQHTTDVIMPNLYLLQNLEGLWLILKSFVPAELKIAVSSKSTRRTSSHYYLPSVLSSCFNRIPNGPVLDLIVLGSCKAQQLISLGNVTGVSSLTDLIVQEFRSGVNDVPSDLTQECMRLELTRWHELAHRCSDVNRVSMFTQELATKVKAFVTDLKRPNYPQPSSEISLLTSAFLLNTCDWEYLIVHCTNSRHRFIDFAKLLAALCHEFSKGGITRTVAKDFFDLMLPTMVENMRGQLLTRHQFTLMIKMIKEQMAITVLLSFFGKLFNCKQAGLTEIFVLNSTLWPATFTDASNVSDSYLKEVLTIILENGLIVNPNNAFWLRTVGDFHLVAEDYNSAIKYYLQSLTVCTDYFTKPLPDNIVDDKLILNLIKCCGRLECHTAEALFSQFMEQPNYNAAIKALQESTNYDGMDAYFPFIWDVSLLEFLISNSDCHETPGQQGRLEEAIRVLNQQEINIHNSPAVVYNVVKKRKVDFLSALCCIFL